MVPDPGPHGRFGRVPLVRDPHTRKFLPIAEFENGAQFCLRRKHAFLKQLPDRLQLRGIKRRYLCHVWHFCAHVDLVKPFSARQPKRPLIPAYNRPDHRKIRPHYVGNRVKECLNGRRTLLKRRDFKNVTNGQIATAVREIPPGNHCQKGR
jgi:hypothetical protein